MDVLGLRLGRYEIRQRIGRGGMAAVYKAWDTNLDRWVAVKILHEYLAEEQDFRDRFEREAKLVASLNHPNIVQMYDFAATEQQGQPLYYMVMAFIDGPSLRARMEALHKEGARLKTAEIQNIMRGVCGALSYAHQRGMAHRDVTPGNILFNDHGEAVLADFGIARMVSSTRLTQTGTTSGTPVYMSPEQGIGQAGDTRSDIYSLGIILYEMLTGKAPYEGDSAFAVIMKHVNEPVPTFADQNPDLRALQSVVFRALAKDPEDRFQTTADFLSAFERAIVVKAGTALLETQDSNRTVFLDSAKTTKAIPTKRRPSGKVFALVGGLAAVLIGGLLIFLQSNHFFAGRTVSTLQLAVPPIKTKAFAPSMTAGPLKFVDHFDPKDENRQKLIWPITQDEAQFSRKFEDGVYRIQHTLKATALSSIFNMRYQFPTRWQYEADLTISTKSQPDTAAGIAFRFLDDQHYYVFAVNASQQFSLWVRFGDTWQELRNDPMIWTENKIVHPAGESNHLMLIDNGKNLRGFVNGQMVANVTIDPLMSSGGIGIYLASTQADISDPFAQVDVSSFSAAPYIPSGATTVPMMPPGYEDRTPAGILSGPQSPNPTAQATDTAS